ncbi:hypothetical protein [Mycobacterium shigaense]|uniref:Uncharacterized protein n=1 Tax=Mycobacterium shigaense TaxID=722731 RepID=A0A1Z4EKE3_9MYCO|nr:hypothetical protein [Mycobacterium shigaense]BAX93392.1 hypothetical protein MSG_03254 [Mycobacterium shigaense]
MTEARRRGLNNAITRTWSFLAPVYDLPPASRLPDQHRIPRPPWTRIVSDLITTGTKS